MTDHQVVRILAGIPTQRAGMPEYVFLNIYLGSMRVSGRGLILGRLLYQQTY